MPINQGRVGPLSNYQDNSTPDALLGKAGETITSDLHGKWYSQAVRGNVYYMSTVVAGLAIPISTTTAPLVMLWNPAGSGKNAELIRFSAAQVSGTAVAAPIGLQGVINAGSSTAGTSQISAFAQNVFGTNTFNAILGGPNNSVMRSSSQGTNTSLAVTTWLHTLFGTSAMVSTSQANNPTVVNYDFDGTLIVAPGNAVWVAAGAATVALFAQTLVWAEVPIL